MSDWYETFENEEVQRYVRSQAATISLGAMGLFSGTALLLLFGAKLGMTSVHIILIILSSLLTYAVWGGSRLRHIRQVLWCVKLSDRCVAGYDYARRLKKFDWINVQRIDLLDHALRVEGANQKRFEVPHLFPDFATLSHRIMHYAEFYEIPVFVNGRPWQSLDVYAAFPSLHKDAA